MYWATSRRRRRRTRITDGGDGRGVTGRNTRALGYNNDLCVPLYLYTCVFLLLFYNTMGSATRDIII